MHLFKRMGHAALQVSDLKRSLSFYKDILGLEKNWEGENDWANLKLGQDDLSLVKRQGAIHPPHIGFRVESLEDLKKVHQKLENAKVKAAEINEHRDGSYSFYFYDPDGNILEALFDPKDSH